MLVRDVMTHQFATLETTDTLQYALVQFAKTKQHILPVVQETGQLVGILPKNRLIEALADGRAVDSYIEALINYEPYSLQPTETIPDVRQKLLRLKIGHAPVLNEQQQPIGMMSTTEILAAYNQILERMESELELMFHHLNFGLFSVDLRGQMISMNHFVQTLLGWPDDYFHFGELPQDAPLVEVVQSVVNERQSLTVRLTINQHSLFAKGHPLYDQHDELIGVMIVLEDVTQLEQTAKELHFSKEWEHKLRTVVELAYDGLILVNEQFQITMVNDGFCQLFNVTERDVLNRNITTLFPELQVEESIQKGVRLQNVPTLIKEKQSLITILPIHDGDHFVGAICKITYQGLTQLQKAIQKVNQLEQQVTYYEQELTEMKGTKYTFAHIIGESQPMQKIKREAYAVAQSRSTVLLLGESGTGKELFAHAIHASSKQTGAFIQINCAAIPGELLEAELFGYAEGAFTGAKKGGKKGKFELAQNGTLFLDEIGDMPYPLQTKLLRVLQEKEFEPLGSHQTIQLDTKIIAATNRDLPSLIQQGKFREDLYYRLHIMPIHIPPLRERMEDLPSIVEEIIRDLNRSGFRIQGITHPALARLLTYDWPGNVRELYNMLERAANLTTIHAEYYIDLHHLPEQVTPTQQDMPVRNRYEATKKEAERATIIQALREANGNKARASRLLGISRTWLYNQIQQFHIEEREYLD